MNCYRQLTWRPFISRHVEPSSPSRGAVSPGNGNPPAKRRIVKIKIRFIKKLCDLSLVGNNPAYIDRMMVQCAVLAPETMTSIVCSPGVRSAIE